MEPPTESFLFRKLIRQKDLSTLVSNEYGSAVFFVDHRHRISTEYYYQFQ